MGTQCGPPEPRPGCACGPSPAGTPGSFPSPGTQAAALAAQLQQAQQQGAQGQQQQPQQQPPKQLSEEERREVARAAMAEVGHGGCPGPGAAAARRWVAENVQSSRCDGSKRVCAAGLHAVGGRPPCTLNNNPSVPVVHFVQVIRPEVVEKLAMLLMVVSQEEQDRRLQGQPANEQPQQQGEAGTEQSPAATGQESQPEPQEQQAEQQQADEPAAMEVDSPQPQGVKLEPSVAAAAEPTAAGPNGLAQRPAAAETAGAAEGAEASPAAPGEGGSLYQAQERLVLTEFRDALQVGGRAGRATGLSCMGRLAGWPTLLAVVESTSCTRRRGKGKPVLCIIDPALCVSLCPPRAQMISRVIGEKVDKKAAAAQQAQQLLLPPLPPPAGGTPGAGAAPGGLPAAMLGALGLPQLKPGVLRAPVVCCRTLTVNNNQSVGPGCNMLVHDGAPTRACNAGEMMCSDSFGPLPTWPLAPFALQRASQGACSWRQLARPGSSRSWCCCRRRCCRSSWRRRGSRWH